jgi:hypothetical protein
MMRREWNQMTSLVAFYGQTKHTAADLDQTLRLSV